MAEIEFDYGSRHELVPILMALQHLYLNCSPVVEDILSLIAGDITPGRDTKRGCIGMSHWENLVLGALRLGCDLDFDQLADLASNHRKIRQILGLSQWDETPYKRSTVHDNFRRLRAETIRRIDELFVACGHDLVQDPLRQVRADSFVLEKNIHHPYRRLADRRRHSQGRQYFQKDRRPVFPVGLASARIPQHAAPNAA